MMYIAIARNRTALTLPICRMNETWRCQFSAATDHFTDSIHDVAALAKQWQEVTSTPRQLTIKNLLFGGLYLEVNQAPELGYGSFVLIAANLLLQLVEDVSGARNCGSVRAKERWITGEGVAAAAGLDIDKCGAKFAKVVEDIAGMLLEDGRFSQLQGIAVGNY